MLERTMAVTGSNPNHIPAPQCKQAAAALVMLLQPASLHLGFLGDGDGLPLK